MLQANSDNQPLLEEFKTEFTAIIQLKMDISAQENQLNSLITHLKYIWLHLVYHQINDLPPQNRHQLLTDFIFKKLTPLLNTDQQYKDLEEIQSLVNQLDSMYQELELLEKKNEELEQKLMASGVTQEQLLRYLESNGPIERKPSLKN